MIPKPKKNKQGNIMGDFYPLQREELMAMRKAKLINNTAFVHLALRYENPFCDKAISLIPKEFALRWQIPESSVYEAVGKLKSCNAIAIKSGKLTIEWVDSQEDDTIDSQQDDDSDNPEKITESQKKLRNPRKNSESSEKILESQKKLRNPRKNSESSENQPSKPARSKASKVPHTIQTNSDLKDTTEAANCCVLEKFKDKLHFYQVYLEIYDQASNSVIPNPKIATIRKIIQGMPAERAERAIAAFLAWLPNAKNVRCKYAAFASSLRENWED
jgi:hypothetical protein